MVKKRKSPEEELELAMKLREEANRKIAEAKKKVKEEEEKEALKLAKKLIKTYATSGFEEIREKIKEENNQENTPVQSSISEDDLNYLKTLASELKNGVFVKYKEVFEELKHRF